MGFIGLLISNLLRNRRRTLLTLASVAVSLFLVSTLMTVLTELENPLETPESALRLVCRHRVSLANILPASHRGKIARVPGVEAVIGTMWFGGIYKDPKNFFAQFAVDTDRFFDVLADVRIPGDERQAFFQDKTGAIAGRNLAARFGWKTGDRIHLQGTFFDLDLDLILRGIYSGGSDDGTNLYFHWDYFNEGMKKTFGPRYDFTGFFTVRATSAAAVPEVARQIDALFRNSNAPTKTEGERTFVLSFLSTMGNIRLLVSGVCSVVILTIVLVAANTMALSIRERVREIGVLKALGFRTSHVLGLLLGESVLLALCGSLVGAVVSKILYSRFRIADITEGFIQSLRVTPGTLVVCVLIGILIGIVSAGLPAWRAARRPVIEALRDTG